MCSYNQANNSYVVSGRTPLQRTLLTKFSAKTLTS
jgi:hypothetical protein